YLRKDEAHVVGKPDGGPHVSSGMGQKRERAPEGARFVFGAGDEIRTHDPNLGKRKSVPFQ
ncbi:MAG: hypothetical protein KDK08_13120, partial [Rhizobiaceae bacterium]|nr:hypothetical protein [Rhizobiaceae bacterium]